MKVGYATHDWGMHDRGPDGLPLPGGACWARCVAPAAYLARNGVETVVGKPVWNDRGGLLVHPWGSDVAHACDVIVLQRCMRVELPDAIRRARALGQVVVNDLDDWFWGMDPRNTAWRASHPAVCPDENRDHYARSLGASTALTVSTPYLASRLARMVPGVPVLVVPNGVDLERYTPRDDTAGRSPTIGWVGAVPWRSGDLKVAEDAVRAVCGTFGLRFHHAGQVPAGPHTPPEDAARPMFQPAGKLMRIPMQSAQPMCSIYDYPGMFGRIDVGIVPLSDQPFNRAKSAIKGLEYAAAGVPFVASAMPEYLTLAREGIGVVAGRHRDWQRELAALVDPGWRAELRERGLEAVKAHDLASTWTVWADAYRSLL